MKKEKFRSDLDLAFETAWENLSFNTENENILNILKDKIKTIYFKHFLSVAQSGLHIPFIICTKINLGDLKNITFTDEEKNIIESSNFQEIIFFIEKGNMIIQFCDAKYMRPKMIAKISIY